MKILFISSLLLVAAYANSAHFEDFKGIIETVNRSGAKWKAGQNFGENTTVSSLKGLLGVRKNKLLKLPLREKHTIPDKDIPESFDAREHWPECESIRHIRDQGTCGSCWAVAAAGAFTDRVCIATKGKFTTPLSAEELLACCTFCGHGCKGGNPYEAWMFFVSNGLGCQPYEIEACEHHTKGELPSCDTLPNPITPKCQRKCTNPSYTNSFNSDHHKIRRAYVIRNDVKEIQKEIMTHGPVEADYTVYSDFMTYKSGIYSYVTGDVMGGHAVKLIGWGVEDGTPYWLVANQWNERWGEKGLFRILRGNNECDFESDIVGGVPIV
ncbi:Cat27 [Halyomorpha halys]|nr:Cat27 [Halyomorpha halys]